MNILLIPDTIYWVTGKIARAIANHNKENNYLICSGYVLKQVLETKPYLLEDINLIHFLCPYISRELIPFFSNKIPVVTTFHHVYNWEMVKHNINSDAVMVVSQDWKHYLLEKGLKESSIINVPNGVNTSIFSHVNGMTKSKIRRNFRVNNKFLIGFFGKQTSDFGGRKGIDVFIDAASKMGTNEENVCFLIVGPGWKDFVKQLKINHLKVIWFPYIFNYDDLAKFYQALDCYWITSRIEGGPVTLLEAMSCGIPCITTNVGIVKEFIKDGENGIIVPFDDPVAFVDATTRLMNDNDLQNKISRQARKDVIEKFDEKYTSRSAQILYEKAFQNYQLSNETYGEEVNFTGQPIVDEERNNQISPNNFQISKKDKKWLLTQENKHWLSMSLNNFPEFLRNSFYILRTGSANFHIWRFVITSTIWKAFNCCKNFINRN